MAEESTQGEISLEDLVGQVDDTSTSVSASGDGGSNTPNENQDEGKKESPAQSANSIQVDNGKIADLENLLAVEDPTFASAMVDLKKQGSQVSSESEIDTLDLDSLSKEKLPSRLRVFVSSLFRPVEKIIGEKQTLKSRIAGLPYAVSAGIKSAIVHLKSAGIKAIAATRTGVKSFIALPGKQKLVLLLGLAFGGLALVTFKLTVSDRVNPFAVGTKFLKTAADSADAKFTYDENEPIDDFTDPLFHPEHVVMFDKFVINLRRPSDGSNPMGLFEFYLEASNQDCAVELKDREGESRDVMSRAIEQMSYNELITGEGKEKLKVVLRKAINGIVTRGQVRRVFIKTVVLKP